MDTGKSRSFLLLYALHHNSSIFSTDGHLDHLQVLAVSNHSASSMTGSALHAYVSFPGRKARSVTAGSSCLRAFNFIRDWQPALPSGGNTRWLLCRNSPSG